MYYNTLNTQNLPSTFITKKLILFLRYTCKFEISQNSQM